VAAKRAAAAAVEGRADSLVELSHWIHAHPEVAFEEQRSADRVASALSGEGFDVEMGACGLPTAFIARVGSGPLHLAICAEYDALPAIGHACGHNVIAAAAVGAGVALAGLADDLGLTVSVLGTPAEEGGGARS
jgi:metal-dependent amidase/aminoacylase/carboxypeptidase family protein